MEINDGDGKQEKDQTKLLFKKTKSGQTLVMVTRAQIKLNRKNSNK